MEGRIGALHVHYRAPAAGAMGAALAPGLDRAIHARLGDAIADRLDPILGHDEQVVVIRELTAAVRIGKADWSLDSRVVDKLSRASVDAVATALGAPADTEYLVRFEDQAAFVGSFIVDLMGGSAWDHWYYGAFRRFRKPGLGATIEAVLTDNAPHAARVFGWLARRGHLAQVLALLGPSTARRLATANSPLATESLPDLEPLAAAAFDVLRVLGWTVPDAAGRAMLLSRYRTSPAIPPSWTDRRSLSAWLLGFAEFIQQELVRGGGLRQAGDPEALRQWLDGPLDWLDTAWLGPRLDRPTEASLPRPESVPDPTRRILDASDEQVLERLAAAVSEGRFRLEQEAERDEVIVQLLAMIGQVATDAGPPSRTLVAVIERIADAWRAHANGATRTEHGAAPIGASPDASSLPTGGHAEAPPAMEAVRVAGPAAVALLRQLVRAPVVLRASEPTRGAGLFLLTRALLDVRLSLLAREAGVPFDALRGTLAMEWLGVSPPFDGPASLWVGSANPDFALLDAPAARLADLEGALLDVLVDQRTIDVLPADETLSSDGGPPSGDAALSHAAALACRRIAWMVVRSWSRWLPGFGGASLSFLVRNCLQREGRVAVSDGMIEVELDPAPLDVVLEMAGYFRPIEFVPWLDGRTVTFTLRRKPRP